MWWLVIDLRIDHFYYLPPHLKRLRFSLSGNLESIVIIYYSYIPIALLLPISSYGTRLRWRQLHTHIYYLPCLEWEGPWKRPHGAKKLHIDCRKWWSKTRYILRIYQGPTRLRRTLSLISYHVFVYHLVGYCTYSCIVGLVGLAGVLNVIINQSTLSNRWEILR